MRKRSRFRVSRALTASTDTVLKAPDTLDFVTFSAMLLITPDSRRQEIYYEPVGVCLPTGLYIPKAMVNRWRKQINLVQPFFDLIAISSQRNAASRSVKILCCIFGID